jgi:hypothetical protein
MSDFSFNHCPVLLFLYIRQASILLTLQFGACFILVSSSPNTLSKNNLAKMKTKKKKTATLKQQINMCKEIVQVPSKDKYLFQFSKKGKQFDIQQLKENL